MRRIQVALVPIVLGITLAGCTPGAAPSSSGPPTSAPSATSTTTPTPEPFAIPECESLLSLADAQAVFSADTGFIGEFTTDDFDFTYDPWAGVALHAATQARLCVWGVPNSDGVFSVRVGELAEADKATLVAALSAAGASSTTTGTVTAMSLTSVAELPVAATNLFTGSVWIEVTGNSESLTGSVAGLVLDSLRTANPTLGL